MKTILIVDDEADIALTLKALVERDGYRALTAFDGTEALHKIVEEHPDLVVTDITMPRMDGLELIEKMRSTAGVADTPVILMSAHDHATPMRFLRKPFTASELLASARELLDGDP